MIKKIFFASIFVVIITGIILPGLARALPYWDILDTVVDPLVSGGVSLTKQGNYLYVAAKNADSLAIIDATNPSALSLVGTLNHVNFSNLQDVEVSGNYAYLVNVLGLLSVVDISNPATPTMVTSLLPSGVQFARDLEIVGTHVYLAGISNVVEHALFKIDISNPLTPTLVNTLVTSTTPFNGAYSINLGAPGYLYMIDNTDNVLRVIDVTGITPVVVGSISNSSFNDVVSGSYRDGYIYISSITNNMLVVDVRQPTAPVLINTIAGTGLTQEIDGNYLFKMSYTTIDIYDISSPLYPILLDTVSVGTNVEEFFVDGTTAFFGIPTTVGLNANTVMSIGLVASLPPPQLVVEFESGTYSDLEANGLNKPVLTVSGGITTSDYSINVEEQITTTAGNGVDFLFTSPTTVTIPANDYTLPVSIPLSNILTINDDPIVEQPDETIDFILNTPSANVTIGTQDTTVYTIDDDDVPPLTTVTVEFDAANYSDLESVGGDIPVLTVLGGSLALPNSIDVAYVNGTATPSGVGTDFTFGGTVTIPIPAGSYTVPVLIPMTGLAIVNDSAVEPNETINFILQTPSTDVTVGTQNTTTYTIINNDTSGSSGGGGGGGGGYIRIPTDDNTPTDPVTPPTDDAPAPTQCPYFTEYMKLGDKDVYRGGQKNEVGRLQDFLTEQNFASTMPIDGVFGQVTHYAVAAWQKHYESEILWPWSLFSNEAGTGWFYQSSRRWANMQKGCVEGTILDNGAFLDIDPNRLRVFR